MICQTRQVKSAAEYSWISCDFRAKMVVLVNLSFNWLSRMFISERRSSSRKRIFRLKSDKGTPFAWQIVCFGRSSAALTSACLTMPDVISCDRLTERKRTGIRLIAAWPLNGPKTLELIAVALFCWQKILINLLLLKCWHDLDYLLSFPVCF